MHVCGMRAADRAWERTHQ